MWLGNPLKEPVIDIDIPVTKSVADADGVLQSRTDIVTLKAIFRDANLQTIQNHFPGADESKIPLEGWLQNNDGSPYRFPAEVRIQVRAKGTCVYSDLEGDIEIAMPGQNPADSMIGERFLAVFTPRRIA